MPAALWRYAAIAAQFLFIAILARTQEQYVVGSYLVFFGIATVIQPLVGFGLPDGLVRMLPRTASGITRPALNRLMLRVALTVAASSAPCVALLILAAWALGADWASNWGLAVWWLAYGTIFASAQVLVALGASSTGAFVQYTLPNLTYLGLGGPVLLVAGRVSATHVIWLSAMICTLAAIISMSLVSRRISSRLTGSGERGSHDDRDFIRAARRFGVALMSARVFQALMPWIPVWVLTWHGGIEAAAIYAIASRLVVGVTALLGATRFSVRSRIVAHLDTHDLPAIALEWRHAFVIMVAPTLTAIALVTILGRPVVTFLYGASYAVAGTVLLVLLLATLAEALGGVVDEILKIVGHGKLVLISMACGGTLNAALAFVLAPAGPVYVAWAVVAGFATQYLIQIVFLRAWTPIRLLRRAGA